MNGTKLLDCFSVDMIQMGPFGRRVFFERMSSKDMERFKEDIKSGEDNIASYVWKEDSAARIGEILGVTIRTVGDFVNPILFTDDVVVLFDGKTWYRIEVL